MRKGSPTATSSPPTCCWPATLRVPSASAPCSPTSASRTSPTPRARGMRRRAAARCGTSRRSSCSPSSTRAMRRVATCGRSAASCTSCWSARWRSRGTRRTRRAASARCTASTTASAGGTRRRTPPWRPRMPHRRCLRTCPREHPTRRGRCSSTSSRWIRRRASPRATHSKPTPSASFRPRVTATTATMTTATTRRTTSSSTDTARRRRSTRSGSKS
mmetsp:Transcript_28555/g.88485  ORF Transcript_28555/g.88485 Transcript_28555/m.88485 type:complete len:217 (-) Transcript_28555:1172-1822(-)